MNKLWTTAGSNGWRASSAPRSYWPCMFVHAIFVYIIVHTNRIMSKWMICCVMSQFIAPPAETNGYLRGRCNGGLNQQRSAVCLR